MKRAYIAVQRIAQGGTVYKDGDGAFYLRDHEHPALKGREFCNPTEIIQAIQDYKLSGGKEEIGEVIIQEVFTF